VPDHPAEVVQRLGGLALVEAVAAAIEQRLGHRHGQRPLGIAGRVEIERRARRVGLGQIHEARRY